jgi:hypothetical protein
MPKVLLNSETARAAGIRSGEVRRERSLRSAPMPVQQALNELEREFTRNNLAQLRRCDRLLSRCSDPKLFVQLAGAKERLWSLVFPKAGSRRPKTVSQRQAYGRRLDQDNWQPVPPGYAVQRPG